jgi:hypothetical protein
MRQSVFEVKNFPPFYGISSLFTVSAKLNTRVLVITHKRFVVCTTRLPVSLNLPVVGILFGY